MLGVAAVHRDDGQVLGDGDDWNVDRTSHPLGGAVSGSRLGSRDVGAGHEMHVGPGDAAGIGSQDDGAVHLRQLGHSLGAEFGVQQEPAGADRQDFGAVTDQDEGALVGLQDTVEAVTEGPARSDGAKRFDHGGPTAFHRVDSTGDHRGH